MNKILILICCIIFSISSFASTSYECTNQLTATNFAKCYPNKVVSLVSIDNANLVGADLSGVTFSRVMIWNSNLSNTNLESAYFDDVGIHSSNLSNANFSNSNISALDLSQNIMNNTDFESSTVSGTLTFSANNIGNGVNFSGVNTTEDGIFIKGSNLYEINFESATIQLSMQGESSSLVNSNFKNVTFTNNGYGNLNFTNVVMSNTNFSLAPLQTGITFTNVNFSNSGLWLNWAAPYQLNIVFNNSNLSNSEIGSVDLVQSASMVYNTNMSGAQIFFQSYEFLWGEFCPSDFTNVTNSFFQLQYSCYCQNPECTST